MAKARGDRKANIRSSGDEIFTIDPMCGNGRNIEDCDTDPETGNYVGLGTVPLDRGTSFATPLVAATAALMLAERQELEPVDVEHILCVTSREVPGWDFDPNDNWHETPPECGLIDAGAALQLTVDFIFFDGFETGDTSRWSDTVP